MALTNAEASQLCKLLKKLEWPVSKDVFYALIKKIITVPIEFVVLNEKNQILLEYRHDEEFDAYAGLGTVLRDNENVERALERLQKTELQDFKFSSIQYIDWNEVERGDRDGQSKTRHEIALIFLARAIQYPSHSKFFPMDNLPENILSVHRVIAKKAQRWLEHQ